jgi:hypothetical protein
MTHHELVARLKALREEIEGEEDVTSTDLETPFSLAFVGCLFSRGHALSEACRQAGANGQGVG